MGAVVRDLITELLGLQASEESPGAISDKDIVASATLAIEEIRRGKMVVVVDDESGLF